MKVEYHLGSETRLSEWERWHPRKFPFECGKSKMNAGKIYTFNKKINKLHLFLISFFNPDTRKFRVTCVECHVFLVDSTATEHAGLCDLPPVSCNILSIWHSLLEDFRLRAGCAAEEIVAGARQASISKLKLLLRSCYLFPQN